MTFEDLEKKIEELRIEEENNPVKFLYGYCETMILDDNNHGKNIIKIEYSNIWIKIIGFWNDFYKEDCSIKIPNMGQISDLKERIKKGILLMYEINEQFI